MDLRFSEHEIAFRGNVREVIARTFPSSAPFRGGPNDDDRWLKVLLERGWAAYRWPVEYGGTGWTPTEKFIWERETTAAGLPAQYGGMGMGMLAPVLFAYGNEYQKRRFLPGIRNNTVNWCQGYSEPGSGSDLASLRTRAELRGDHYVVSGEKIWTSYAHTAHWMFCLTRNETRERKQEGITFLLIDMATPGITVTPIPTIDGQHTLNRVHLDNVLVPTENRLGEEGQGWTVAKGLLTHERTGLAYVSMSLGLLELLKRSAKAIDHEGRTLRDDSLFQTKIAELETDLTALEITELRTLAEVEKRGAPGPQSSILKLKGTAIVQRLTELLVECGGYHAIPWLPDRMQPLNNTPPIGPDWVQGESARYYHARAASIAGGTDEVQRDIIARHVLGL